MASYEFFIGSNNVTGVVETDRVEEVFARYSTGFTMVPTMGYWEGEVENSVMVIVEAEGLNPEELARMLCLRLGQDAVGYREASAMRFARLVIGK